MFILKIKNIYYFNTFLSKIFFKKYIDNNTTHAKILLKSAVAYLKKIKLIFFLCF
jgi:hypothetical protein